MGKPSVNETEGVRLIDAQAKTQHRRIPEGRTDWTEFDKDLPRFGLRWRNGKQTWLVQVRVRGKSKRRAIHHRSKKWHDWHRPGPCPQDKAPQPA
jgi:hypothetical protein